MIDYYLLSREERRWIEKQNKAERARRKKEEMSRIRSLVDAAYACDPRIPRLKEEEKQRKLDAKKAKQEAARARAEEEERVTRALAYYSELIYQSLYCWLKSSHHNTLFCVTAIFSLSFLIVFTANVIICSKLVVRLELKFRYLTESV